MSQKAPQPFSQEQRQRVSLSPELLADLRDRVRVLDRSQRAMEHAILGSLSQMTVAELERAGSIETDRAVNIGAAAGAQVVNMSDYRANRSSQPVVAPAPEVAPPIAFTPLAPDESPVAKVLEFTRDPSLAGMADEARDLARVALDNAPQGGSYNVSEEIAA